MRETQLADLFISGADAALFNINATTGAVTFKSSPNYEAPGDAGGNNVYDVTVRLPTAPTSTTKAVAITVTNVNEAPTVTSGATASVAENAAGTVYTVAATDRMPEPPLPIPSREPTRPCSILMRRPAQSPSSPRPITKRPPMPAATMSTT